ncbi:MAG: VanZ [Segetibacter sp.]|nr:VanZ [Segetibacter sp.]
MLNQILQPTFILTVSVMPFWIAFRMYTNKKLNGYFSYSKELLLALFIIYIVLVLVITIIPLPLTTHDAPVDKGLSIVPLYRSITGLIETVSTELQWSSLRNRYIINIIGNIILFIPLGLFLPVLTQTFSTLKKVMLAGFICSLSIELTQLLFWLFGMYRYVDIDDVIFNTTGAIMGYFIFRLVVHVFKDKTLQSLPVGGMR